MESRSEAGVRMEKRITGHGGNPPGNGPFMTVSLVVDEGIVREASYETYQCPACHNCGKAVCELVKGKPIEQARGVNWEALVARVGPLPRNQSHCYSLALLALAEALEKLGTN